MVKASSCAAALPLLAALLLSACGTPGTPRPASAPGDEPGLALRDEVSGSPSLQREFDKATALLREGRYQEGLEALDQLLGESGAQKSAALHINRGIAYLRLDQLEPAEAALKAALALSPDHPVANNEYGMVLRRTGRFPEARAAYEKALEKYPGFLPARRNLGILCDLYLRDWTCAMDHYQAYAAAVPEDKSVAAWIADLQQKLNK